MLPFLFGTHLRTVHYMDVLWAGKQSFHKTGKKENPFKPKSAQNKRTVKKIGNSSSYIFFSDICAKSHSALTGYL